MELHSGSNSERQIQICDDLKKGAYKCTSPTGAGNNETPKSVPNDQTGRSPKQTSNMGLCFTANFCIASKRYARFQPVIWMGVQWIAELPFRVKVLVAWLALVDQLSGQDTASDISTPQMWELPGSSKELVMVWSIHTPKRCLNHLYGVLGA